METEQYPLVGGSTRSAAEARTSNTGLHLLARVGLQFPGMGTSEGEDEPFDIMDVERFRALPSAMWLGFLSVWEPGPVRCPKATTKEPAR